MNHDPTQQIVLRRKVSFHRGRSLDPLAAGPLGMQAMADLAEPSLEQVEMTSAEVADVQRDPEVVAVAAPMPLKLIEPVGVLGAPWRRR